MLHGFDFAFLAVLCELCGKEERNREERQGFAKDAKQFLRRKGKLRPYPFMEKGGTSAGEGARATLELTVLAWRRFPALREAEES
jgi:hypothetical protein